MVWNRKARLPIFLIRHEFRKLFSVLVNGDNNNYNNSQHLSHILNQESQIILLIVRKVVIKNAPEGSVLTPLSSGLCPSFAYALCLYYTVANHGTHNFK